jgi:hypothetical protein
VKFETRIEGASATADKILLAVSEIDRDLAEARVEVGNTAVRILKMHAPRGQTHNLVRSIGFHVLAGEVLVSADPVSRTDGYHYIGVTRFGHKKAFIKPIHERRQASVISTGRRRSRPKSPRKGTKPALAIFTATGLIFRYRVPGYHPATDWVEDAQPEIAAAAAKVLPNVGDKFLRRTGD